MNCIAYTPLLYGKAYLRWAVKAVQPFVNRHIILYTPKPSFGHSTHLPCPDSEEELQVCVEEFDHIEWHTGEWPNESAHRAAVHQYLRQSDELLLVVDADEVWDDAALGLVLNNIYRQAKPIREWRLTGFYHHWRAFCWVCRDAMAPVRVLDLRRSQGVDYIPGVVHHFGYAQPVETMRYKWSCHGHQNELRPGWLEEKYINWEPGMNDVHPTCENIWNPYFFYAGTLPNVLRNHPYFNLEVIE